MHFRLLFVLLLFVIPATMAFAQEWQSSIVFEDVDGKLAYVSDAEGNRIPDFSHAGYRGGGVELPAYPVAKSIDPIMGDNTTHIQNAIDEISALTPDGNGVRGALLLNAGVYRVSQQLKLQTSGVVIRGAGNGVDSTQNTIILRTGTETDAVLRIGSGDDDAWRSVPNTSSNITTAFVPVGARSFAVEDASLYTQGDQIIVSHPLTDAWLAAVDGGGTDSDPPWETDEFDILYTRRIVDVQDSLIFIDAPVFNHLDRSLTQSFIYVRDNTGEIEEVGIESLRVEIETSGPLAEDHADTAIEFVHVANAWAQNVTALHFVYAGIDVRRSIHVTVKDSEAIEPHSLIEGARRYNFAVYRSQLVLFENNLATEGRHHYVGNGEGWDSGIVFLNNRSVDALSTSEPHRHWGQGFLYDNHTEVGSTVNSLRLRIANRGSFGTGHGWAAVHSVAWNCKMNRTRVSVQKPPTAQNYVIGCEGIVVGEAGSFTHPAGYIEGTNQVGLYPSSLYLKQLSDRLGLPYPTFNERPVWQNDVLELNVYPNPFRDTVTLQIQLKDQAYATLDIYDMLGKNVARVKQGALATGRHDFTFAASHLRAGVYIARLAVQSAGAYKTKVTKIIRL